MGPSLREKENFVQVEWSEFGSLIEPHKMAPDGEFLFHKIFKSLLFFKYRVAYDVDKD